MEEVRQACAKHVATYRLIISPGRIQSAISQARSIDPTTGLINVGLFCRFLDSKWVISMFKMWKYVQNTYVCAFET